MKNYIIYILFYALFLFLVYIFHSDATVAKYGSIIVAKVSKIPVQCGSKNNGIHVVYNGMEYYVTITKAECNEEKYKVGDTLKMKYLPGYSRMIRLNENPSAWRNLTIGFIIIMTLSNIAWYLKPLSEK
jgi:hypothetical protein